MKSPASYHLFYIVGSFVAAFIALIGVTSDSPLLYATVPGIIGGISAAAATVRLLRDKVDLAGFVATICGFVFYQAYQANPVTLPDFSGYLQQIPTPYKAAGLFVSNLTTAMLLISYHIMGRWLPGTVRAWVPSPTQTSRANIDRTVMIGFWIVFAAVALPNVLFGKVVVGAIDDILYERMTWGDPENYSGFTTWGGHLGASIANMALWGTSLYLVWLYLLRSKYRRLMLILGPLVLLWTASMALQGSRTPLMVVGLATIVYFLGNRRLRKNSLFYALAAIVPLYLLMQIATLFRGGGLQSIDLQEFSGHAFEIRGNEGAPCQTDGLQYFMTEQWEKGLAHNPATGLIRGLLERPIEGLTMPMPRSFFPWKFDDQSGHAYDLWFINVRLGVTTNEEFLGASPGLIGRELIKYGIFGPLTLFFWLGLLLAVAERNFSANGASDFNRIFAVLLAAFIVAQARDFVPVWFLHFLPAGVVLGIVARHARTKRSVAVKPAVARV